MARRLTMVARKPTGRGAVPVTAGLEAPKGKGNRLRPEELGSLATRLMAASSPTQFGPDQKVPHPRLLRNLKTKSLNL